MACDITSGRAKPCKKQLGGVSKLYLFNWLEDSFTFASGVASAMNAAITEDTKRNEIISTRKSKCCYKIK